MIDFLYTHVSTFLAKIKENVRQIKQLQEVQEEMVMTKILTALGFSTTRQTNFE